MITNFQSTVFVTPDAIRYIKSEYDICINHVAGVCELQLWFASTHSGNVSWTTILVDTEERCRNIMELIALSMYRQSQALLIYINITEIVRDMNMKVMGHD